MVKMKRTLALLLAVSLMFSLAACDTTNEEETASTDTDTETTTSGTAENETYIFTDSAGREVEIPANIERIAPSGAVAQIVLFSIAPDKMVGLANDWSETAKEFISNEYLDMPTFGQIYGTEDLSLEAIAAADPQVIIDIGEAKGTIAEDLDAIQEQLGIPVIFVEASTATMPECYETLGKVLGMEEEGQVLSDYCDEVYTLMVDTMAEIGEENKADLTYCLGDSGTSVIAEGSFQAEIINLLANNVAVVDDPSSKGSGNEVSLEQIYNWDPEYIIFAPDSVYSEVGDDEAWQQLDAIASGNYYEAPVGPYNWLSSPPSVNRYIGMLWLAKLLYPDYFDYDLYEEAVRYYDLFFHTDLTQGQFDALTANSLLTVNS